ncbi:heavy metal translocating P-type ATPase [Porphyromonas crevioricanis]|uniref:HMA domain-containing protein n=1 Tax=Porphyromonas crevioricanis TaxID=393921 RepID=A0AB34PEH0_9PORP|nr:heavy metal translocating P-type ATPase [Porphyromonas crevioricanis]KGN93022.1 hypothetical protein HQ38_09655 [Porphyromonas crevioricanis]
MNTHTKSHPIYKHYPVLGMHCAGCAHNVEQTVAKLPGVCESKVDFAAAMLHLQLEKESVLTDNDIRKAIRAIGFDLIIADEDEELMRKQEAAQKRERICLGIDLSIAWVGLLCSMLYMWIKGHEGTPGLVLAISLLVYLISGRRYIFSAIKQLRHAVFSMDTLIFFSTTASIIYAMVRLWLPGLQHTDAAIHLDGSTMILAFVLTGKWLETRATGKSRSAIRALMNLRPHTARRVQDNGEEQEVAVSQIRRGDLLRVLPGSEVPVDGEVVEGISSVDEQMITGEAVPAEKLAGSRVYAGTVNGPTADLLIRAELMGSDTILGGIIRTVREAEASKAPSMRLADKVIAVFVPVVLAIAVVTFLAWIFVGGTQIWSSALLSAIAVLVIACPCALGLATPTAVAVAVGKAAEEQILLRSAEALEELDKIDTFVFDKTGTLTIGRPTVRQESWFSEDPESDKLRALLYAIEQRSSHPLASALAQHLRNNRMGQLLPELGTLPAPIQEPGRGVSFVYRDKLYRIGSVDYCSELIEQPAPEMAMQGSQIYFARENEWLAAFVLSDLIPQSNIEAIAKLQELGKQVVLLSGDRQTEAERVAQLLSISEVKGELLPEDKLSYITQLQEKGRKVAMVGDGINDTEAMSRANIGIAMGGGSDIAKEVAQITLMRQDLNLVVRAMEISGQSKRIIRQNLFWAMIYNVISIPIAAGLLYPVLHTVLKPGVAAAAMACSSVIVVMNSLRLRRL